MVMISERPAEIADRAILGPPNQTGVATTTRTQLPVTDNECQVDQQSLFQTADAPLKKLERGILQWT
jgi:hypothetical protein